MTKTIWKLLVLLTMTLIVIACSNNTLEEVSAPTFQKEYQSIRAGTMVTREYLGQKDGYAYLMISRMSLTNKQKWNHKTIYTKISKLEAKLNKILMKINKSYHKEL